MAGYFTIMLGVGWRARKGSADAYWVAERRYSTVPVAASLVATIFGASSTLGIIGLGYARGLTGAWWPLVGGLALVPFAFLLAGRVRHLEVYTLPDVLRRSYDERVAFAGASFIVLAWCGVVAAQIVAGAYLLGGVLDLPFQGAVAVVAAVFVLYTLWGGQLSVVRTDTAQILLFLAAVGASLVLVARAVAAGGGGLDALPEGFLSFPVSPDFSWYQVLVYYPVIVGLPYLVGPDIYSRILCARDGDTARRAALWAAVLVVLLAGLGLLIHALSPGLTPEAALPSALTALGPVGLKGLIVVGFLGAIMSSADTTLISASTIFTLNVVDPLAHLGTERAHRLTRVLVVVLGGLAWAIAAFQHGIIASLLLAYTVFVGGVVLPTLAGFWKDRLGVTNGAALAAVLVGGGAALLGSVADGAILEGMVGATGVALLESGLGPEYGSLLPVVLSGATLVVGSRVARRG